MLTCITQLEEVVFFFEPVYIDAFDFTNSRAFFFGDGTKWMGPTIVSCEHEVPGRRHWNTYKRKRAKHVEVRGIHSPTGSKNGHGHSQKVS